MDGWQTGFMHPFQCLEKVEKCTLRQLLDKDESDMTLRILSGKGKGPPSYCVPFCVDMEGGREIPTKVANCIELQQEACYAL